MDSDTTEYLNEKISTLDSNLVYQLEKDQLTVVKSTLTAISPTMRDFKTNQDIILETESYLTLLQDLTRENIRKLESIMVIHSRGLDALRQGMLSTMLI